MHHQGSVRFNLLLGWCSLLSVAMVIMAIVLASNSTTFRGQERSGEEHRPPECIQSSASTAIRAYKHSWTHEVMSKNDSLNSFQNNLVTVTAAGLYYVYAQVTFMRMVKEEETVSLIMNKNLPDKSPRKLTEVQKRGSGTVSVSQVVELMKGDTVNLNISNGTVSKEGSKTYWGLLLLANKEDK